MKAIHKTAVLLWQRISSQVPTANQANELTKNLPVMTCKQIEQIVISPKPLTFAGYSFTTETHITGNKASGAKTYYLMHKANDNGVVTYCSPYIGDIKGHFMEVYYNLKTGYTPLRE